MKKLLLTVVLAAAAGLSAAPKVLVYMLDGARADVLEALNPPAWKMLKENSWAEGYKSAWSVTARNEPFVLPASAPNHVTIATGKLAKKHKVLNNKDEFYRSFSQKATPTFLERIGRKDPAARTVLAFSWRPDLMMIPESGKFSVVCGTDANNNQVLVEMFKRSSDITALMVLDDAPDHAGHKQGFYPFNKSYLTQVSEAMKRFGNLLEAIKSQPSFAQDDWLIVLCSDHGGVRTKHNVSGGQCNTVPLLYCGKKVQAGQISGRPGNLGIAANVLRHFGYDDEVPQLDDDGSIVVPPAAAVRPITEGLMYDLSVNDGKIVSSVPHGDGGGFTPHDIEIGSSSFSTGKNGYLTLDGLKNFKRGAFTFALTLKCDQSKVAGDPVIFGNKDWQTGANPGIALVARKDKFLFNSGRADGAVDYVAASPRRLDLYDVVVDGGKNLVAVSVDPSGMVTVFQKDAKGVENWFCAPSSNMVTQTGLDWNIGQDATGKYKYHADFEVSRFLFWERALTLDELRKLEVQ